MNSWFMVELMCSCLNKCPFSKPTKMFKSQSEYVFSPERWHRELERFQAEHDCWFYKHKVGRVKTRTVKTCVWGNFGGYPVETGKTPNGTGSPLMFRQWNIYVYIYILSDVITIGWWIWRVAFEDNVADPLTKPLARVIHERHVMSMEIRHINECF